MTIRCTTRVNSLVRLLSRVEGTRTTPSARFWHLWTGTLTLAIKPFPRNAYLIVRWENRWERSNQRVFGKDNRGTEDTEDDTYRRSWFETVLGVVVTTNL